MKNSLCLSEQAGKSTPTAERIDAIVNKLSIAPPPTYMSAAVIPSTVEFGLRRSYYLLFSRFINKCNTIMVHRQALRSATDDVDPEDARRRILFPGVGSTLSSTARVQRQSKASVNGSLDNNSSVRFSKVVLACTAVLSVISIRTALQIWDKDVFASPNMLLHPSLSHAPDADAPHQSSPRLIEALKNAPIGSLGPSGTNRKHMRYYDTLFYTTMQYGADAKSIIEVGCASDPFLKHLSWIDQRTCVAPYFVEYGKDSGKYLNTDIKKVTADFMEYELPNDENFDLLLCNQVLEHVPNPAAFMKKLIASARTSIISVPYNWGDCGKTCNHKTNHITIDKLKKWSAPYVPVYHKIVEEEGSGGNRKRAIVVFETI